MFTTFAWERQMAQTVDDAIPPGDEIFENTCLLFRDALISREFTDAALKYVLSLLSLLLLLLLISHQSKCGANE
jgi:hypothetical protein